MDEIRVLIVGDNPLARAGLAAILSDEDRILLLGEVNARDPLSAFEPDVLIWDIGWHDDIHQLSAREDTYPVLVLVPDTEPAPDVWAAVVQGVLLRTVSIETLILAVQSVAQGLVVLDPAIAEVLNPVIPITTPAIELTPREMEVLQLLAEGLSNKGIAFQLGISDHTVKFHVNAIMTKLSAQSRTEAAVKATRLGLITI